MRTSRTRRARTLRLVASPWYTTRARRSWGDRREVTLHAELDRLDRSQYCTTTVCAARPSPATPTISFRIVSDQSTDMKGTASAPTARARSSRRAYSMLSPASSRSATIARELLLGLNTGTGRWRPLPPGHRYADSGHGDLRLLILKLRNPPEFNVVLLSKGVLHRVEKAIYNTGTSLLDRPGHPRRNLRCDLLDEVGLGDKSPPESPGIPS